MHYTAGVTNVHPLGVERADAHHPYLRDQQHGREGSGSLRLSSLQETAANRLDLYQHLVAQVRPRPSAVKVGPERSRPFVRHQIISLQLYYLFNSFFFILT